MLIKTICSMTTICSKPYDEVKAKIVDLAERHNKRMIHPAFYAAFTDSLFDILRQNLGQDFTEEVEYAWVVTFSYVMSIMMPVVVKGCQHFVDQTKPPKIPSDAPALK